MRKILIIGVFSVVFLSACGLLRGSEENRFIDATVEATCLVLNSENYMDPTLEDDVKNIYLKYNFPVEDEEVMIEIASKYEENMEVVMAIEEGIEECAGDVLEELRSAEPMPFDQGEFEGEFDEDFLLELEEEGFEFEVLEEGETGE